MFADERYHDILELLQKNGSVTVAELMELFGASPETVRRDLLYLESCRLLKRVHGGAMPVKKQKEVYKLSQRFKENAQEKSELSETAASLVCENDVIALDSGSTSAAFVSALKEKFHHLTVVTHSMHVFHALAETEFKTILLGGEYLKDEGAFYGYMTLDMIKNVHVSKAFLCPDAVSLTYGFFDQVHEFVPIQRALLEICDKAVFLADSSKFESTSVLKICDLSPEFIIVTDSKLSDEIYNMYREREIPILKKES